LLRGYVEAAAEGPGFLHRRHHHLPVVPGGGVLGADGGLKVHGQFSSFLKIGKPKAWSLPKAPALDELKVLMARADKWVLISFLIEVEPDLLGPAPACGADAKEGLIQLVMRGVGGGAPRSHPSDDWGDTQVETVSAHLVEDPVQELGQVDDIFKPLGLSGHELPAFPDHLPANRHAQRSWGGLGDLVGEVGHRILFVEFVVQLVRE
jgi:hypothetical protein